MDEKYYLKFPSLLKEAIIQYNIEFPKETQTIYQRKEAFRGIVRKEGEVATPNNDDFLSYAELGKIPRGRSIKDIEIYSCSCYKTQKELEVGFKLPRPNRRIIKGLICDNKGCICVSKESGHIHWWIYENANPAEDFEVISDGNS